MRQITVEAFEDESRPQGGHAVILLHGLDTVAERPTFRLKPVDAASNGEERALRGRALSPLAIRKTHQGIELLVGPEVVANPRLLSGTPVIIELPEAGVRGEFLWPSVRPLLQSRRRNIVVTRRSRAAEPDPDPGEGTGSAAAGGSVPLDTEALARLLGEVGGEPIALGDVERPALAANGQADDFEPSNANPADADASPQAPAGVAENGAAGEPAAAWAAPASPDVVAAVAPPPPAEIATEMKWTAERDARQSVARWTGLVFVGCIALLGAGLYSIATRTTQQPDALLAAAPATAGKATPASRGPVHAGDAKPRTAAGDAPAQVGVEAGKAAAPASGGGAATGDVGGDHGRAPQGGGPGGAGKTSAVAAGIPGGAKIAAPCQEASVSTEAMAGGHMRIRIQSACRAGQTVTIAYGGAEFVRTFDAAGRLDGVLDCFAGSDTPAEVRFADGGVRSVAVTANDLDRVSKVAVLWKAPVDLDLNAFEYAARAGEHGHVSAARPSSFEATQKLAQDEHRGRGFLSSADGGASAGDKIEVYTFIHAEGQESGLVALALDYASRGDVAHEPMCGTGALAEVAFRVVTRLRSGQVSRQTGIIGAAPCGARIDAGARHNASSMPALTIRK